MKIRIPNSIVALLIICLSACTLAGCKKSAQANANIVDNETQGKNAGNKKDRERSSQAREFQTDKLLYQPGEEIQLKINVQFQQNSTISIDTKDFVQLTVNDSKGKGFGQYFVNGNYSDDAYSCETTFNAPKKPGEYSLTLKFANRQIDSDSTFSVR